MLIENSWASKIFFGLLVQLNFFFLTCFTLSEFLKEIIFSLVFIREVWMIRETGFFSLSLFFLILSLDSYSRTRITKIAKGLLGVVRCTWKKILKVLSHPYEKSCFLFHWICEGCSHLNGQQWNSAQYKCLFVCNVIG